MRTPPLAVPRTIRGGGIFEENDGGDMLQISECSEICYVRIPSGPSGQRPYPYWPFGPFPPDRGNRPLEPKRSLGYVRNFELLQISREKSRKTEAVFLVGSRGLRGEIEIPPARFLFVTFSFGEAKENADGQSQTSNMSSYIAKCIVHHKTQQRPFLCPPTHPNTIYSLRIPPPARNVTRNVTVKLQTPGSS